MLDKEIIAVMVKGVLIQEELDRNMLEEDAVKRVNAVWNIFIAGQAKSHLKCRIKDMIRDAEAMLIELRKQGFKISKEE